jgi:multiple antibiotic resistance protein
VAKFGTIDAVFAIDILLLLLIGIGPKIAFVPYLRLTVGMDTATKRRVITKMISTAAAVAIILILLGELLSNLLHFSHGALSIAGGLILLILAIAMVLGREESISESPSPTDTDPMRLASYPLAVPYLLNPAGIVVLVAASAETTSIGASLIVLGALAAVLGLDVAVFLLSTRISAHMNEDRMLVTEKVFGFLLAALAIQLVLNGLWYEGVIHLNSH